MPTLTDQMIADALLAGDGLLSDAARYLTERLCRPISRATVAAHVEASRVLRAVQQIAEQRAVERVVAAGREARRQRRSEAMKESWTRRQGQADAPNDVEHVNDLDAPNARMRARGSSGLRAFVQQERDRRLCCARTRKGFPCVRRVVPGRRRCPNHGGLSTGPKTEAGKARIAAAQRARWERFRQERAHPQGARSAMTGAIIVGAAAVAEHGLLAPHDGSGTSTDQRLEATLEDVPHTVAAAVGHAREVPGPGPLSIDPQHVTGAASVRSQQHS